jgi:hypothetical protein
LSPGITVVDVEGDALVARSECANLAPGQDGGVGSGPDDDAEEGTDDVTEL